VEDAAAYPAREFVLDGEAIALGKTGRPLPFQITMRRFGRRLDVSSALTEQRLSVFYFDCLYLDAASLLDRPARERAEALSQLVPSSTRLERTVTADPAVATMLFHQARERGHEGLMAKALESSYAAGGRGSHWLKLKSAHTLDLVVLAAEWGSGRRRGFLSNLHLGARDRSGGYVMLGKTFKGLTDAMLSWQTIRLLELERDRDRHVVWVRPELVVEIAFSDVQDSSNYPGGVALRFARVRRYREDKLASEADSIDAVIAIREKSR
jgi:DNA ligase-1